MDSGVWTAIVMAVSAVGVAGISGWYSYRAARRNSESTRAIEQAKLSTASWESQVKAWREDVVALRQQRAEDTRAYAERQEDCTRQIVDLTAQVKELQRQRYLDEQRSYAAQRTVSEQLDALTTWARRVVALLNAAGVTFPPPPPGI